MFKIKYFFVLQFKKNFEDSLKKFANSPRTRRYSLLCGLTSSSIQEISKIQQKIQYSKNLFFKEIKKKIRKVLKIHKIFKLKKKIKKKIKKCQQEKSKISNNNYFLQRIQTKFRFFFSEKKNHFVSQY